MSITDKYIIREQNEKLILKTIIQEKEISRADLAKQTKLNKATISSIVNTLLEQEYIREIGSGESSGGRKPILVTFNKKCGISISIDLGEDYISAILTYLDGTIIKQMNNHPITITSTDIILNISKIVDLLLQSTPPTTYGLVHIALGIHGIVQENRIIFSPFYELENIDVASELSKIYSVPVILENEANLSAIGEKTNLTEFKNLVSVSIHTGIGAGIILNGELYTGIRGYAGEIGHLTLFPNGVECPCGNTGCLELYASEKQLLKQFNILKKSQNLLFEDLKKDYINNNKHAIYIVNLFIQYISIGIHNIISTFNPEIIVINSTFIDELEKVLFNIQQTPTVINKETLIVSSTLKDKSTLIGGSYLNSMKFFGINYI